MPDVFGKSLSASRSLYVDDLTIGTVSITQNYSTVPYHLQLPSTQGITNSFLTNNGSGLLTWRDEATLPYIEEVGISVPSFLTVTNSPITPTSISPTMTIAYSNTPLPIANGGTGQTILGTVGKVLQSNGTTIGWSETTGTEKVVLWRSPTFANDITVPVIRGGGIDGSLEITTLQPGGILSLQSSNAVGLSAPAIFLGESSFPAVKGGLNTYLKTTTINGNTAWSTIDLDEIIGPYGPPGSVLSSTGAGVAWTDPALIGVMTYKQIFFQYDEDPVPPEVQIWQSNGTIDFRTMYPVAGAQYGLALTYTSEFGEFRNNYDFTVIAEISYSFARHVAFGIPLFSAPSTIDFNTQIDSLLAITATFLNGQSLFWVEVNNDGKPLAAAGAPGGAICCASTTVILQPGDFFQFRANNKASADARIANECEATINLTSAGPTTGYTPPSPGTGTVTSVNLTTSNPFLLTGGGPITTNGNLNIGLSGEALPTANGGTGSTTATGTGANVLQTSPSIIGNLTTPQITGSGAFGDLILTSTRQIVLTGQLVFGSSDFPSVRGSNGQVLTTNGAGTLSWTNPTVGTVTSVSASAPLASSGGATPNISFTGTLAVAKGGTGVTTSTGTGAVVRNLAPNFSTLSTGSVIGSESFGDLFLNSARFIRLSANTSVSIGSNDYPNGTGAAGQVLYTNGGGTLFWATPPGGGVGGGTVTSVGLTSSNAFITVGGTSPITSAGVYTLAIGTLPVLNGGTGVTTSTGTGSVVLNTSPSFTTSIIAPQITGSGAFGDLTLTSERTIRLSATTSVIIGSNTYPTAVGSAGQILVTNGAPGIVSWSGSPTLTEITGSGGGFGDLTLTSARTIRLSATTSVVIGSNTYPVSIGGEGQVLTANGFGAVAWQTPGGLIRGSAMNNGSVAFESGNATYKAPSYITRTGSYLNYSAATGRFTNNTGATILVTASYSLAYSGISTDPTTFWIELNGTDTPTTAFGKNKVSPRDWSSGCSTFVLPPSEFFAFVGNIAFSSGGSYDTGSTATYTFHSI